MTLLPLVILVIGAGTVSVILDRRWRAKRQKADTEPAEEPSEPAEKASSSLSQLWAIPTSWYYSLVNKQPADLPQRFREWAVESMDDAAVKDWLNALSDDGLKAYTKHLSGFCSDMGFELVWLVEKQLENRDHNLAEVTQGIVLYYCQACQQAATCQEELEVFKQILSLEQNPTGRKNRTFGEKLLARMVEAGLVTTSTSEFISASAQERQEIIVEAINEAASKDQAALNRLVREVLYNTDNGAPPASESADGVSANSASGTQATNSA